MISLCRAEVLAFHQMHLVALPEGFIYVGQRNVFLAERVQVLLQMGLQGFTLAVGVYLVQFVGTDAQTPFSRSCSS